MEQSALQSTTERVPAQTLKEQKGQPVALQELLAAETQQVCFVLSGGEYGVDINLVGEIIKPTMDPTPVPQSPPFVIGVIDLRGDIIPIIDLKKRFDIRPTKKTAGEQPNRILVIRIEDIIVGFLVDAVTEVIRVNRNKIQDAPGKVVGVDREYIWGVTKRSPESNLIMLLDIPKILRVDEEIMRGEKAEML